MVEGLTQPAEVAAWIDAEGIRVLNVAGNRESPEPFLIAVFGRLTLIAVFGRLTLGPAKGSRD